MFLPPVSEAAIHGRICRMCCDFGADVQIHGCGCEMHARCVPLNLIVSELSLRNNETKPVPPNSLLCPSCHSSVVSKIHVLPLFVDDLDNAVDLRKKALKERADKAAASSVAVSSEYLETQAETSYLMFSHNHGSSSLSFDHEYLRTGRWTDEEIAFVDFLVEAFDTGRLPVEHGLKLNDFLADFLLCKSSRLTKKMKNARLSVRAYKFVSPVPRLDIEVLSSLEQKFLASIVNKASRLELKFNMSRLWRVHLSNLCLQIGSSMLDTDEWIASVEEMERKAAATEERFRKARRRRMGLALRTDVKNDQEGVLFSGLQPPPKKHKIFQFAEPNNVPSSVSVPVPQSSRKVTDASDSSRHSAVSSEDSHEDFISNILDFEHSQQPVDDEDFSEIFDDDVYGRPPVSVCSNGVVKKNSGVFLDELVHYMESHDLPFQYVDLWVPSLLPNRGGANSDFRLFHGGYATCHQKESPLLFHLDEFGEYSTKFSFPSGVGLPGRVFATMSPVWERWLDEADPKIFERAGGAKVYGVKTGFGFPLRTNHIGVIVVAMYSCSDLAENPKIMNTSVSDLSKLSPEPKWKLVVEVNDSKDNSLTKPASEHPGFLMNSKVTSESTCDTEELVEDIEHQMAGILGIYMPLSEMSPPGESTHSGASSLVPHFMSLRLLLLRDRERRSEAEKEMVDIIKSSYQCYAKDIRRGKREIAFLVVKDWQFLNETMDSGSKKPAAVNPGQHQSHVLEPGPVGSYSSQGAPVMMPNSLPFVDPSKVVRRPSALVDPFMRLSSSFAGAPTTTSQRKLPEASSVLSHNTNVNMVESSFNTMKSC